MNFHSRAKAQSPGERTTPGGKMPLILVGSRSADLLATLLAGRLQHEPIVEGLCQGRSWRP